ncbi:hypothetical protein GCM10010112_90490 [Actinoplanes lobatus]|uniref:Uncharacterized protein n=1 Tax=Actinoplanes lobatus TaxID=113568 RepID=A0ABQ4AXR1_9ACTN|nr:hypothetical protein GCM10010112_90490 [Actinoplanes lobatus]GIE45807.1 hypothetical protein Alo02nite_87050 [Actinoplanes lobatus]
MPSASARVFADHSHGTSTTIAPNTTMKVARNGSPASSSNTTPINPKIGAASMTAPITRTRVAIRYGPNVSR